MKLTVLASTHFEELPDSVKDTEFGTFHRGKPFNSAERVSHFAGRACYQSWHMPNPDTATDAGYLNNIIKQGHFSVLEHGSVSFYVEGVSRALLVELNTHRHLSRSVVSQRYVDYSDTKPVIPPAIANLGGWALADVQIAYDKALDTYNDLVETLTDSGLKRKQAREAARAVLPNAAPVDMVVTGNHRAWRDMLYKRYSEHADAEIREFAVAVLAELRTMNPAIYQDFPDQPFD